ncbi:NLI interacting factor family phosphatase [Schizosaccharomyces pombe]|uniref:Uncharacterized protein C2F7.02c n=1 Tax=Schizosaccharomyces pombe (strain 972 / ATCC 24843) TaxID=284812 RepID=YA22_SCHPO|nr:putative NLI-interacting factor-like phosphatase family protein [Schizosaccharomyces pombe]Q09695.1 RecName: Full=Uncharacterized protein C2F7.02c [Schizosaccharomyces pombe 972h-]CAA90489.1 NLI interacting factor family phosphatase (predicted) [Schizosaccharomyces pombe]|eukprot:NP_592973.1 putative NLI-interacting factor-like phosphatase family protein [Schizosaccharomyces pombe]
MKSTKTQPSPEREREPSFFQKLFGNLCSCFQDASIDEKPTYTPAKPVKKAPSVVQPRRVSRTLRSSESVHTNHGPERVFESPTPARTSISLESAISPNGTTNEQDIAQQGDMIDSHVHFGEQPTEPIDFADPPLPEVKRYGEGNWLLPPIAKEDEGKKCLILDLDETLVHSSFKYIEPADFVVSIEIDGLQHDVRVVKRPGVDEFLKKMGDMFEIVVFTASLAKYADPVLDMLDHSHVIRHRLFREACCNYEGNFVKDLSQLGRNLEDSIIIDNSPSSYIFHPSHAVPISSWFNDMHDMELIDLIPFLEHLARVPDVSTVLNLQL